MTKNVTIIDKDGRTKTLRGLRDDQERFAKSLLLTDAKQDLEFKPPFIWNVQKKK